MFDLDNWLEIFNTIKKNKLRTFLTGLSVAWGIFMLIILLGSGNGLKNGVASNFGDWSVNNVEFWGRRTSMAYNGLPNNRRIRLDERDLELVEKQLKGVNNITASINTTVNTSYGEETSTCNMQGIAPAYKDISGVRIKDGQGRFINDVDMKDRRKVIVINQRVKEVLFNNTNPIGKVIIANKLGFTVIGVYEGNDWGDEEKGYIPFTTAQYLFNKGWGFHDLIFDIKGIQTEEEYDAFEADLRSRLAKLHQFNPEDRRAIGIWNNLKNYLQTMGIFNGINFFVWFIGIGTLFAGIIGVSNIMLIAVRERTREFGIRKALGAKPFSILQLILMESIFITSVFGYIGMFLGILITEAVSSGMQAMGGNSDDMTMFKDPTVGVDVALGAVVILIIAGVLAGYFPARKALKITAVEAMRAE